MTKEMPTILVVEDDPDSRLAICVMLRSLGDQPLDFESGPAALKGIQGKSIELVLLDIMMPVMNGYEVLTRLKAMPEYSQVPIIMVTAREAESDILGGYQAGADYYITKPFTAKQLEYGIKIFLS